MKDKFINETEIMIKLEAMNIKLYEKNTVSSINNIINELSQIVELCDNYYLESYAVNLIEEAVSIIEEAYVDELVRQKEKNLEDKAERTTNKRMNVKKFDKDFGKSRNDYFACPEKLIEKQVKQRLIFKIKELKNFLKQNLAISKDGLGKVSKELEKYGKELKILINENDNKQSKNDFGRDL